jgi:uncharacterized membrane protein YecN with MAPEG domain
MSTTTIVCIALMGALLFLLGANVTRMRAQRGPSGEQFPTDPADKMLIAIRAHGNAAEYVPTLIVLLIVCSTLTDSRWIDALAIVALAARAVHAVGIMTGPSLATHTIVRDVGAAGTYLTGLALAVTALVNV